MGSCNEQTQLMSKKVTLAVAVMAMTTLGCAGTAVGPANQDDVAAWMEFYEVPGVSIAVINDFELDYVEAHGVKDKSTLEPVTALTLFQAASISKSVSSMGVVRLMQEGTVSLDADINDYLTSWQLPDNSLQNSEKVTLRRLMSHTAGTTVHGFRGYRYTESVPTLIQILNGESPANSDRIVVDLEPGSDWRYSGGGYVVMDQAVRDVTGETFPEFIWSRVLQPMGMDSSTFEQPLPDSLVHLAASSYYSNGRAVPGGHHIYPETAAAALWTTPSDLARYVIEVQFSLRGESNRVLSKENTELLLTEVMNDYALGHAIWIERGQPYFGHNGANDGMRSNMVAHLSAGYGVVIMTNSDNGSDLAEAVVKLIGEREGWPGY